MAEQSRACSGENNYGHARCGGCSCPCHHRHDAAWWYAAGWEDARGQLSTDVVPDYVGAFANYAAKQDADYRDGLVTSCPSVADQWTAFTMGERVVMWLSRTVAQDLGRFRPENTTIRCRYCGNIGPTCDPAYVAHDRDESPCDAQGFSWPVDSGRACYLSAVFLLAIALVMVLALGAVAQDAAEGFGPVAEEMGR